MDASNQKPPVSYHDSGKRSLSCANRASSIVCLGIRCFPSIMNLSGKWLSLCPHRKLISHPGRGSRVSLIVSPPTRFLGIFATAFYIFHFTLGKEVLDFFTCLLLRSFLENMLSCGFWKQPVECCLPHKTQHKAC